MTTVAFTFTTRDLEFVVLTGTKALPVLHSKKKILLPANYNISEMAAWFETQLDLELNNIQPSTVAYRLTLNNVTNNYVSNVYYGQGILNLLCQKKGIRISYASPASLVASKFNQPKGTDLIAHIENLLGAQTPPWDKGIKGTALIALLNLV